MKFTRTGSNRITRSFIVLAAVAGIALSGVAPKAIAQTTSVSGFTYNGIVYTSWWFDEYGNYEDPPVATGAATTSMDQLQQEGGNYVSVLATQYVQTGTSTTIAPLVNKTPLDDQVVFAIQSFHNLGMKVFLKPHVDSVDGTWRGAFEPTSIPDWFASFQTFILHYAQIAQANNVEGLIFGTEYKTLSVAANESYWANIISQIRAVYTGQLAYGANAVTAGDEFTTVSFWPLVDLIGVDGYVGLTDLNDPTVAQLVAAWTDSTSPFTSPGFNAVAAFQNLNATYGKPVIFTEIGYDSVAGSNIEPYANYSSTYDGTEQEDCYEAFFEVFSQQTSWMKGVFWWNWTIPPLAADDLYDDPNGKPAGTITLPKWFGSALPGIRIATETPAITMAQNSTATATITIADTGGYTGSVTLAVSGLPAGVTASFATNPTTTSSVLTLTANGTATANAAKVTITGTSGSYTSSTTISLTILTSACNIVYTISPQSTTAFGAAITIDNLGTDPITAWTLTWSFANGQTVSSIWGDGTETQSGANVTVTNASYNGSLAATTGSTGIGFNSTWNGVTNAVPTNFALNGTACTVTGTAGFTVSASAPTLSIAQGSSGTDTIAVTDVGGFTGSVTLTASGLPTGVTAAFATNPTTGTSLLTLTASSTATAGSSAVTITGTSGTLTASTTIALTVTSPGFTLSASAPTLSIAQGNSGTDTITVTDAGGFTGSVSFVASGLPSGVTAAFGTNPTTGTSLLTLTASATATPGTSTVTITGISGTLTASTTISLTVTGPPNFTLSRSASALSIADGSSGTDTITVIDSGGFTGSVTLAASGLPSGVTAVFGTNPTTGASLLTFTASATAAAGTYTVTITGTSGALTASTTIALTITSGPVGFACHIVYTISSQWSGGFGAAITIDNTGTTAISNWTLTWAFANGQTITQLWNGNETQSGANVTVTNVSYNGSIPAGGSYSGTGFNGTWNNTTNAVPTSFAVNGTTCK